jgi:hypothetical protein
MRSQAAISACEAESHGMGDSADQPTVHRPKAIESIGAWQTNSLDEQRICRALRVFKFIRLGPFEHTFSRSEMLYAKECESKSPF